MTKKKDGIIFWNTQQGLIDYFKPYIEESDYSIKAIYVMQNQYDCIGHNAAPLLIKFLEQLNHFSQLMQLNNEHLIEEEPIHQSVNQLFDEVLFSISQIENIRDNHKAQPEEYAVYTSALEYAKEFIAHHVAMLEQYEPESLALKWYQEHLGAQFKAGISNEM